MRLDFPPRALTGEVCVREDGGEDEKEDHILKDVLVVTKKNTGSQVCLSKL
jgi:hypothetical protein